MTYEEIKKIAKKLDKDDKAKIDKAVEARLKILKEGELTQEELDQMEECLYSSLVLEQYLDGEYDLLAEERAEIFSLMEDMYNEYGELLSRAKLEEKLSKKKRMALELMQIREQLFKCRDKANDVKQRMEENTTNNKALKELSSIDSMQKLAQENKEYRRDLDNNKRDMAKLKQENEALKQEQNKGKVNAPESQKRNAPSRKPPVKRHLDKHHETIRNVNPVESEKKEVRSATEDAVNSL